MNHVAIRTALSTFALWGACQAMPALAQDDNKICSAGFDREAASPSERPWHIDFSYRSRDGNMTAEIKGLDYDAFDGKDPDNNYPMTLIFDTGKTTTSRSGGYENGFYQLVWGGWGPEKSPDLWAMLKDASSVQVKFDKQDFGTFKLGGIKGFARNLINTCLKGGFSADQE